MQLNAFTDYALRTLVYAAARPDERCLTADVAGAYGISRHHIVKVVNGLQHLGYIETTRGRTGGFRLARSPENIRVGDVIRRTESSNVSTVTRTPARSHTRVASRVPSRKRSPRFSPSSTATRLPIWSLAHSGLRR